MMFFTEFIEEGAGEFIDCRVTKIRHGPSRIFLVDIYSQSINIKLKLQFFHFPSIMMK